MRQFSPRLLRMNPRDRGIIFESIKIRYRETHTMAILGNPFVANAQKQLSLEETLQALRVDIAGELEAIIGYEAHIAATTDQNVKTVLAHISDEEKRHVGELQQLLFRLCPNEQQFIEQGKQDVQTQLSQGQQ